MRKIIFISSILCILAASSCKSKKTAAEPVKRAEPKVTKVVPEKVDIVQRDKAYDLGKRVLTTCNTSRFKPFNSTEATPNVIKNTTEERLTKTCHNFRLKYGEFKDIRFIEVVRDKKNKIHIYRFKADYEKKIANKELRITMNDQNQVTAIKSLDWNDIYK